MSRPRVRPSSWSPQDRRGSPSAQGDNATHFRWFVTLWVLAFTFHSFEHLPDAWPVLVAGIPSLIAPGSVVAFVVFLVVSGWVVAVHLPAISNHLALAALVELALAGSAASIWWSRRGSATKGEKAFTEEWLDRARTPALLSLLVIYFFVVFDKLNTSFFNSTVSCAGTMVSHLIGYQGIDPGRLPQVLALGTAVSTIACETLILVCLAVPRLRRWGILFGVLFHSVVAWARFYDFSSFLFAVYVLFIPRETAAKVRHPDTWRRVALAGWGLHALVSVSAWSSHTSASTIGLQWHTLQVATWLLTMAPLMGPLLHASFFSGGAATPVPRLSLRPVSLLLIPALAFFNGATPYLGIKTVANYSMFSNLRVEQGRSNHLVPGVEALQVTHFLSDTVDVKALRFSRPIHLGWGDRAKGDNAWLARETRWISEPRPIRIPWLELRRAVLLWKDAGVRGIQIRYVHHGAERAVRDAVVDRELTRPLPLPARYLLAFRAIQQKGPVVCRW